MRILSSIVFVVTTFAYLPAQVPEPFTGDLSSVFAIWPNRPTGTRIDLFYVRLKSSGFVETQQQTFTRMYVFGDSYSDTGAGYVDGNGPTAVAYLAAHLGFKLALPNDRDANSQSLNFAVSGAQTGLGEGRRVKGALLGRGMANQVNEFAGRVRSKAITFYPNHTLFFLAGGLNDERLPNAETVANLRGEIRTLYSAGARCFSIALLPTAIPGFRDVGQRLNPDLRRMPHELEAELPGAHVRLSHWGEFFDDVMRNPSKYGIENTKNACAGRAIFGENATPCAKPAAYYYYHEGHPSTAVHKIVGDKLYAEIVSTR
jgi:phospholipase/lecithinase/hemolysin